MRVLNFGPLVLRSRGGLRFVPTGSHTNVIGACTGLCALIIAIIAGLGASNPFDVILTRALLAMAAGFVVGLAVGAVAEHAFGTGLSSLRDRQAAAKAASLAAQTPPPVAPSASGAPPRQAAA